MESVSPVARKPRKAVGPMLAYSVRPSELLLCGTNMYLLWVVVYGPMIDYFKMNTALSFSVSVTCAIHSYLTMLYKHGNSYHLHNSSILLLLYFTLTFILFYLIRLYLLQIRPCSLYLDEYKECKSIKGRFHQYYIYGDYQDCTKWKEDFDNCEKMTRGQFCKHAVRTIMFLLYLH